MIRNVLLILFYIISLGVYSQDNFSGNYSWSGPCEGDPWGRLLIYQDSDSTFLYYIETSDKDYDYQFGSASRSNTNSYIGLNKGKRMIKFNFFENYVFVKRKESENHSAINENFNVDSRKRPEFFDTPNKRIYFNDLTK